MSGPGVVREALTSAILGVDESFRNEGTSLKDRRIRLWLNVFYLGKPVKGARLGMDYGGAGPVIVSVDFIDDRTAPGGHVSDRLPALLTALAIRSHIMTMLRF